MSISLHKFTHAQTENTVYLADNLIFAWYAREGSTYIVANGGASIPVKESVEQVESKLKGVKNDRTKKGHNDPVSKHKARKK